MERRKIIIENIQDITSLGQISKDELLLESEKYEPENYKPLDARNNDKLKSFEKVPCKYCGKYKTFEGHDGCISELIGIANACCGHGNINEAYVQFLDGTVIKGKDAVLLQAILKRNSINYNDINTKKEERFKFMERGILFYKENWNL
jgi:hypothetical protein